MFCIILASIPAYSSRLTKFPKTNLNFKVVGVNLSDEEITSINSINPKRNKVIERVKAIREATGGLPLVLHGGSGIPDDQVKAAIKAGIRKMNIGTDVCCAFAEGTLETLNDPNRSLAIDLFMKKPIDTVKARALD